MAIRVYLSVLLILLFPQIAHAQGLRCTEANTVFADVAAIDQAWVWNRYGAIQPHGMMFALTRDVWIVDNGQLVDPATTRKTRQPGKVALREDKRPRPLVLRVNKGDCLEIRFTNLLDPSRTPWDSNKFLTTRPEHELCPPQPNSSVDGRDCADGHQPTDRMAGLHVTGLAPDRVITDMAQHVGTNSSSLVAPGKSTVYRLIAEEEGTFFAYSPAVTVGSDGNGGAIHAGLFAAVTVEPKGSVWYRSQVTEREMRAAVQGQTSTGHPRLTDYASLGILKGREIVHSDLNAVIDLRKAELPAEFMCLDEGGKPLAVCGDRKESFREFTVIFHDESGAVQAFKEFDPGENASVAELALARSLHGVRDGFAINYGTSGAGAEVLANRKGLGPVKNCKECQMEEFFLSSWVVGDPAMIVDKPANMQAKGQAFAGQAASKVYFPDDPSNVYHSYLNDRVVIRNLHAGPKEHHVFHLHAHQWLQTQANSRSPYLDSQTIGPGGAYSYEIAYGGSGNRNKTAGDSIFHCHFYPHFAQGMWALWRVHDTFEAGTALDESGRPLKGARALPDGEIETGTPIPAVVPLPNVPMAPLPGKIVIANGQIDSVAGDYPGYPFYYPAKAGNRPPPPPLDIAHNGGLDRHIVVDGTIIDRVGDAPANLVKDYEKLKVAYLPEGGTSLEIAAMQFHQQPFYNTTFPDGAAAQFLTNGLKQQHGAPFADPCRPADGWSGSTRKFQIAAFQYDMVLNKKGWHFPQARILALNEDVEPTLAGTRLPQPLFFRVNSGDCVEVQHTNVVPKKMRHDAFQLQVPTDIIGQHIHLVKFDVQASDGGANGFNYEDGTPAAQEIVARIKAIRKYNDCDVSVTDEDELEKSAKRLPGDTRSATDQCPIAEPHPWYPNRNEWIGGQITMQRWFADPQKAVMRGDDETNKKTFDKTLETVFTHDHFGASNHQQVGLYAGLIVEPANTVWYDDLRTQNTALTVSADFKVGQTEYWRLGNGRKDGGPTSWKALVIDPKDLAGPTSFREFALAYGDFQLAYTKEQYDQFVLQSPNCSEDRMNSRPAAWRRACVINRDTYEQLSDKQKSKYAQINGLNKPHQVADAIEQDYTGISPKTLVKHEWLGNGGCKTLPIPCAPEIVSADDVGVMSINYRSEPLAPRISYSNGKLASGDAGSLAHVFQTIPRADTDLNANIDKYQLVGRVNKSSWPMPTPGMLPNDPFTPILEIVERDRFRIRLLAGAHEHEHSFTINGLTWLNAPHEPNSGYRSFVGTALSEHFEFAGIAEIPSALADEFCLEGDKFVANGSRVACKTRLKSLNEQEKFDHLYRVGASIEDSWYGNWGVARIYRSDASRKQLPSMQEVQAEADSQQILQKGVGTQLKATQPGGPGFSGTVIPLFPLNEKPENGDIDALIKRQLTISGMSSNSIDRFCTMPASEVATRADYELYIFCLNEKAAELAVEAQQLGLDADLVLSVDTTAGEKGLVAQSVRGTAGAASVRTLETSDLNNAAVMGVPRIESLAGTKSRYSALTGPGTTNLAQNRDKQAAEKANSMRRGVKMESLNIDSRATDVLEVAYQETIENLQGLARELASYVVYDAKRSAIVAESQLAGTPASSNARVPAFLFAQPSLASQQAAANVAPVDGSAATKAFSSPLEVLSGLMKSMYPAQASKQVGMAARTVDQQTPKSRLAMLDQIQMSIPRLVDLADPQEIPVCRPGSRMRYLWVTAIDAKTAIGKDGIVYHRFPNGTSYSNPARGSVDNWELVHDPNAMLYVHTADLVGGNRTLKPTRKVEPFIAHVRADDCVRVWLDNKILFPGERDNFSNLPNVQSFNVNEIKTPDAVGIHAQSLRKHPGTHDGMNVGINEPQTIKPGQSRLYVWYAGKLDSKDAGLPFLPIEFGALNLMPADPIKQSGRGLFGAIIVQPKESIWAYDWTPPEPFDPGALPQRTRASLAVFPSGKDTAPYRDFVLVGQNDANFTLSGKRQRNASFDPYAGQGTMASDPVEYRKTEEAWVKAEEARLRKAGVLKPSETIRAPRPAYRGLKSVGFSDPVRRVAQCVGARNDPLPMICPVADDEVDSVDAGHKAFNFRSEAGWMRRVHSAAMPRAMVMAQRQNDLLSDGFDPDGGPKVGPNQTPRFCAMPGDAVRIRLLFPNGHGRNHVIEVAGHQWDDQPFDLGSTILKSDLLSEWRGTRDVVGPGSNWNLLLRHGAGGSNAVRGDYAIRDLYSWGFDGGLWAVLRVNDTCG